MALTRKQIKNHYLQEGVKKVLLEATELDKNRQALITGHRGWYRFRKQNGKKEMALKTFKERTYEKQIKEWNTEESRSLYWSTNYFEPKVFREWIDYEDWKNDKVSKPGGYGTTGYYRLGIDIDLLDEENLDELEEDRSVDEEDSKEMLEKAAQFACDWFKNHNLSYDILRPYFSGNGCYVTISPEIVKLDCEADKAFKICEGFNALVKQIEKEFFEEEKEAKKYVKFDALNNASRPWKSILSIHKSKPYACTPLNPVEIEIDRPKASLPLSKDVIEEAKEWIRIEENREEREKHTEKLGELLNEEIIDSELFDELLKKWSNEPVDDKCSAMDIAEAKRNKKATYDKDRDPNQSFERLDIEIEDLNGLKEVLPPCLGKLIEEKNALSHARGKALLARTLDLGGFEQEKAKEIFNNLTTEAGGPTSNIFQSWYDSNMCLPSCEKIQAVGSGYPSLEVGDLNLCDSNELCEVINNPFGYIKRRTEPEEIKTVREALEELDFNPNKLGRVWDNEKQKNYFYSVRDCLGTPNSTRQAVNKLRRDRLNRPNTGSKKNNIDKPERKRLIARIVKLDLQKKGKLLKGESGGSFYYYEPEKKVYRFAELDPLLQRLYDIPAADQVGKIAKSEIKGAIENEGEEVKVRKLWYWNTEDKKLYVYDKDRHYFVLDGEEMTKKPNGTDGIYFLFDSPEDAVKYVPKKERDTDFGIPGTFSENFKAGDCEVNELLANQTKFTSTTNLTAEEQRLQLLLHTYTLPFGELIPAKPIMLFTGEKGSTKSFTFKKMGRFFMVSDFRCRPLPSEEDFYVAVTKNPLTFFDNVESKPEWLEDALARVATEVRIAKRMLYEDFKEAKRDPKTFLGLTAREINFNRDDVMDRSLLFHVKRVEDYIGEKKLEKPIKEHKNTLWSQYLDNLNKIVARLKETGIKDLESQHRLADWACLAMRIAEALGYDNDYDIDRIFEKMETERAAYVLRDCELYQIIKKAKVTEDLTHDEFVPASQISDELRKADQYFNKKAKGIGRELNSHENEYGEIFGLEIKTQGDRKVYKFPSSSGEEEEPDKEKKTCEECNLNIGKPTETDKGETKILCENCKEELGYDS